MKSDQLMKTAAVHALVFGEPKTGKSLLAAKLALKGFKILWLSLDNGFRVIFSGLPPEVVQEQFEFIVLPDTPEFPVGYSTVLQLISGKPCHICDIHGQVDCSMCKGKADVTWTDVNLSTLGKEWIIVLDHATHMTKSAATFYAKGKNHKDDHKFEFDDWRMLGVMMDKIFLTIQNSKNNWVVISHVIETEMEDGKKKLVPAIGTGNYARNSAGFFDHVIHCDVANMRHNFGSATTFRANVITGSRSNIAIEKLTEKDGKTPVEASLAPFFDGTIPKPERHHGEDVAKKFLEKETEKKTETPIIIIDTKPNGIAGTVSNVAAAATSTGPAAGVATSMHAPVVAAPVVPPVASAQNQDDRAAQLLASLRGGTKK